MLKNKLDKTIRDLLIKLKCRKQLQFIQGPRIIHYKNISAFIFLQLLIEKLIQPINRNKSNVNINIKIVMIITFGIM